MRVAFFTESFPATSETFILDQIIESVRAGHCVHVFPVNGPTQGRSLSDFIPDRSIRKHITIHSLDKPPSISGALTLARTAPYLASLVKRYGRTNMTQVISHLYSFSPQQFDVIHGHFGPSARRAALLKQLGWLTGPLISTFHGFDVHTVPRKLPLSYYNIVFDDSNAITCGSHFMRDKLIWMGAPRHKVHLLPMPVDVDSFPFRPRTQDTLPIQFLSVGRLNDWKSHIHAIEAFSRISDQLPEWHYSIIGAGEERVNLESAIQSLGLEDKVILEGKQNHSAVAKAMYEADILLHPSIQGRLGSVESQGVVLAEAAATGLPIIAYDSGGISDTVIHQKNGLLVPEGSVVEFAEAIKWLTANPDVWPIYGENGRAHVVENYNTLKLTKRRHQLYDKVATPSS